MSTLLRVIKCNETNKIMIKGEIKAPELSISGIAMTFRETDINIRNNVLK